MRSSLLVLALTGIAGCAQAPVAPLSDELARVELRVGASDRISAYRLDGELVRSLRFPDLSPGHHNLQVRYHFSTQGGSGRNSLRAEPEFRTCILAVEYPDFAAGKQYQLSARRLGWNSVGWLESSTGERLARARVMRCGPGV